MDEADSNSILPDPRILIELANARMPFGKYEGRRLLDLPEAYLVWFKNQGFPRGKLGMLLESALEVRIAGAAELVTSAARASGHLSEKS